MADSDDGRFREVGLGVGVEGIGTELFVDGDFVLGILDGSSLALRS